MNMLKKGPELKLPDFKVPDFLLDIFYDLRERHLLPLVAILLVAIVALPIALSGGSSDSAAPEGATAGTSSSAIPTADLVVAKAMPGLRDYRRRLGNRPAQDPFAQQYTEPAETAGATSSTGPSTESSATYGESTSPSGSTTATPESGSAGDTTTKVEPETKYATDSIDVRIVPVGSDETAGASKAEPTVRRQIPELTMLPSRETPVAVFMGASSDGKKALLLISSDVQSVFGDGRCVVGSKVCQLLALEEGLPETFVYGPQARTYRLEILKIDRTLSDKPHRATLGEPKKQEADGQ